MLMSEPTPQMFEEWKATFEQFKDKLRPNKKTAYQVRDYLEEKYPLIDVTNEMTTDGTMKMSEIVTGSITMNEFYAKKVPSGATLKPLVFSVMNAGLGKSLYDKQDGIFKGCRIIVGLEFTSDYFMVEGSSYLHDEIRAFQGLDSDDLINFFLVAEYVECLGKFGMLEI